MRRKGARRLSGQAELGHKTLKGLLAAAKLGDKDAMNDLLKHCRKFVLGVAFGELCGIDDITQRSQDAEDVTQNVLIYAWKHITECRGNFRGWIKKIAKRDCVDVIRKRKQLGEVSLDWVDESEELGEIAVAEILRSAWNGDARLPESYALAYAIRRGIALLPPMQQAVMKLRRIGYRHKEIASELGIAESSAKEALSQGRCTLEAYLSYQGVLN